MTVGENDDMYSGTTKALQALWVGPTNEAFIVGASDLILRYGGKSIPEKHSTRGSLYRNALHQQSFDRVCGCLGKLRHSNSKR